MLALVFSALIVLLDQFFKHWIVLTIPLSEKRVLIPGILGLTHVENTGAAFSILSDQRWLLAGIAFVVALVLVFILMRYNEGFWGTLGLAAVLGGAVGNLIDRVLHGYVVDMFYPLFMNFAIFNVADVFITLGGLTFCVFFIIKSFKPPETQEHARGTPYEDDSEPDGRRDGADIDARDGLGGPENGDGGYDEDGIGDEDDEDDEDDFDSFSGPRAASRKKREAAKQRGEEVRPGEPDAPDYGEPATGAFEDDDYITEAVASIASKLSALEESEADEAESDAGSEAEARDGPEIPELLKSLESLESLESELRAIEDYDVDRLLQDYGFEEDSR